MSRLLVLLGGESAERDVSRSTARSCVAGLQALGHELLLLDPMRPDVLLPIEDLLADTTQKEDSPARLVLPPGNIEVLSRQLRTAAPDLVFNCLHGGAGEDGRIAALLDLLGLACSSSPPLAAGLAMDKARSKVWMRELGVPTPDWSLVRREDLALPAKLPAGPWVVKPNAMGSSVGIYMVEDRAGLEDALQRSGELGDDVLIESFIAGRELTQSWLNGTRFPSVEIAPKAGWYDYSRKYSGGTDYHCPAELPQQLAEQLALWTEALNVSLGCSGVTRTDFRLDGQGRAWCLELNTTPGMTATSLVPKAAAAIGWDFQRLLCEILRSCGVTD